MVDFQFVTWDLSDDMRLYWDVIGLRVFSRRCRFMMTEEKRCEKRLIDQRRLIFEN